jgi:hypothetical protein
MGNGNEDGQESLYFLMLQNRQIHYTTLLFIPLTLTLSSLPFLSASLSPKLTIYRLGIKWFGFIFGRTMVMGAQARQEKAFPQNRNGSAVNV